MEPAFRSLQSGWEGKLLMSEMTVMKKGLGAVTLQIKRAQPKPKARGWDMIWAHIGGSETLDKHPVIVSEWEWRRGRKASEGHQGTGAPLTAAHLPHSG